MQRRKFFKQVAVGSLVTVAAPAWAASAKSSNQFSKLKSLFSPEDERYWEMVKKQFVVPPSLTMVNAANLCPSPYFVNEQVQASLQKLEKDVSFQNRAMFTDERKEALEALAKFVGATVDEVGITRNTTESNNILVHGIDLKKGDEVVLWEQNHPSNNMAWEQQASRLGFVVKKIALPANPSSAQDLVAPFRAAISPKTKLISFSHVSNTSGLALPAKALCALAREKHIMSLVDGAQTFGMMDVNLKEMGCDFYTGSTNKWLMGPLENGILYIRKDRFNAVLPGVYGAGWKSESTTVDEKFCVLGQRNETTASAIKGILDFQNTIGKPQIEARVKALNSYLKKQIAKQIPSAEFITPLSEEFSAGVTIVSLPGQEGATLYDLLYKKYGIACAPTGGLRLSPHVYNTKADMDKIVSALAAV